MYLYLEICLKALSIESGIGSLLHVFKALQDVLLIRGQLRIWPQSRADLIHYFVS